MVSYETKKYTKILQNLIFYKDIISWWINCLKYFIWSTFLSIIKKFIWPNKLSFNLFFLIFLFSSRFEYKFLSRHGRIFIHKFWSFKFFSSWLNNILKIEIRFKMYMRVMLYFTLFLILSITKLQIVVLNLMFYLSSSWAKALSHFILENI